MTKRFGYDVFLSYSSRDKPIVRELAKRLKHDGLRVWLDEWEIKPGDPISFKIEQGLEESRTLVLFMSANAFASDWVALERHTALFRDPTNHKRRFVPVRLDDADIKDVLKQYAYIDWRQQSEGEYSRLLAACRPSVNTHVVATKSPRVNAEDHFDQDIPLPAEAQRLPVPHPGLESAHYPDISHPILCLLNEAVIHIYPDKQLYSMQFTHLLKNVGRDPITQVPCSFYANIYPDDPGRCREWYSVHKISWEELKFQAWDNFGPLDVELRSDFNAAKDIVAFFSGHGIDRPIYNEEVRTFCRRFEISFELWGSDLDRAVRDPTDRLRVNIVAPASLPGFRVGGKELPRTGPVTPLQTAPRRTIVGTDQVWTWEERAPKLGYTYRLKWSTI